MGANRQNLQRIINDLHKQGLVAFESNPHHRAGTTAERHERELKHLRILCTRFSEARGESFCPLDTGLSWMSANRELAYTGLLLGKKSRLSGCILRVAKVAQADADQAEPLLRAHGFPF
jgi:hypothetical protein